MSEEANNSCDSLRDLIQADTWLTKGETPRQKRAKDVEQEVVVIVIVIVFEPQIICFLQKYEHLLEEIYSNHFDDTWPSLA